MNKQTKEKIENLINSNKIFLFMKGTPDNVSCGFSARIVEALDKLGLEYGYSNVLEDEEIRQAIKEYSDWPTIPQLFINGKFIGGVDIVEHLYFSGELQNLIEIKN